MPPITIERHILNQQRQYPYASGAFTDLLYDLAFSAKLIAREMMRAGLVDLFSPTDTRNVHGEIQQQMDLFADSTIRQICGSTGRLCALASEENEEVVSVSPEAGGKYLLVYDPLDGSSNIDVNVCTGTIFGIYRKVSEQGEGNLEDVLQLGRHLAAAGYIIYGPSVMLIYSTGLGVHAFTLDHSTGEFLLTRETLRIPAIPKVYSVNQGRERYWPEAMCRYVQWLRGLDGNNPYVLDGRYSGSLVMDFHRILLHGGVYLYPADVAQNEHLSGKLRLVYEANPLAFLVQQAGGYASDSAQNILDLKPKRLHQKTPLFIGNRDLVKQAETYLREYHVPTE
jgi:fructose-1,6-bisphosphatase I